MKRQWTRGEKWLWAAPLIFLIGAAVAAWGPQVARRQLGLPIVLRTAPDVFVTSIALSSDGSTLAATTGQLSSRRTSGEQNYFWNARTLEPFSIWNAGTSVNGLFSLALSPDGKTVSRSLFTTAGPADFGLYDRATQRALWKSKGVFFSSPARFSPDGRKIATARLSQRKGRNSKQREAEYLIMRVADGKVLTSWSVTNMSTESALIDWAPDGKTLACQAVVSAPKSQTNVLGIASYQTQIRRASDGVLLKSWLSPPESSLEFSPDGQRLVAITFHQDLAKIGDTDYQVAMFDAANGRRIWRYGTGKYGISSFFSDAKFSPNGKDVATVNYSSGQLFLLDSQEGTLKHTLSLGGQKSDIHYRPNALAFAPNGKRLYARGQNAVLVWDLD